MVLAVSTEPVADIPHRPDKAVAGVFYLATESPYVDIDRSVAAKVVISPNPVEQGITGKNTTGIACQEFKQLILFES